MRVVVGPLRRPVFVLPVRRDRSSSHEYRCPPCRSACARVRGREAVARRAFARGARRGARRSGRAAGAAAHAREPDLALALFPRRHRFFGDDQHREAAARGARRALHAGAAGDRRRAGFRGRHAEMAAALPAARRWAAGRGRDRLYPGGGARHALRLKPGRLHADLHLLPYRHAAHGAEPDGGGDRRADPDRARAARRFPRRRRFRRARSCRRKAGSSPTS